MPTITIDNKQYELDDLSKDAKAQLDSIVLCDRRLAELQSEIAIVQTARNAYSSALQELLPKENVNWFGIYVFSDIRDQLVPYVVLYNKNPFSRFTVHSRLMCYINLINIWLYFKSYYRAMKEVYSYAEPSITKIWISFQIISFCFCVRSSFVCSLFLCYLHQFLNLTSCKYIILNVFLIALLGFKFEWYFCYLYN